jgi:hypothetical protein
MLDFNVTKPPRSSRSLGKKRPILKLTDDDKIEGASTKIFLLVMVAIIRDHDLSRCLVNKESSCDIMYNETFEKLN